MFARFDAELYMRWARRMSEMRMRLPILQSLIGVENRPYIQPQYYNRIRLPTMYSPGLTIPQPVDISIYVVFEVHVSLARDQQLQQFLFFLGFVFLCHNHKRRLPALHEWVHVCVCVCVCVTHGRFNTWDYRCIMYI